MEEAEKKTAREHGMQPLLLTVEEAQRLLSLSRSKIYEMLRAGEIPSIKVGRVRRIPRTALEQYVERQVHEQATT